MFMKIKPLIISSPLFFLLVVVLTPVFSQTLEQSTDLAYGAKAWANNCTRCHNLRDPSEFSDRQWKPIVTHMRIRGGLTGQEARAILVFLQTSNDPLLEEIVASSLMEDSGLSGEQIYKQTCFTCHALDGKGALPGVPDLTQKNGPLSQVDSVLFKRIKEGFKSPGAMLAMPAKGGNAALSDDDINRVLRYLHTQFGP
jgi:cytochrome c5